MTKSQNARINALQRIQKFLDANAAALGTVSKSTSRTDLDTAVAALVSFGAQQEQAQTEATSRTKDVHNAREDLRLNHMQPIAAIARKKLGSTPTIQDMKLPAKSTSDAALVQKGIAMANAAGQYSQVFLDQSLPADFIAQLQAAVTAVQQAVVDQANAKLQLNAGTKGVKAQLGITHTDVKVLNALVVKQLKGRKDLLGAWTNAKRVYAKTGVATGSSTPVGIVGTPIPAPVATPVATPAATPAPASPISVSVTVPVSVPGPAPTTAPATTTAPAALEVPTARVA
jgi:hypothetical protein